MMLTRAGVLAAVIVAVGVYGSRVAGSERAVSREPLASLPIEVGAWHAGGDLPIDDESLAVLGVDDYVNRVYGRPSTPPVSLYIGYYASQRQGDTIHSPQNCLPGAGWQAVESGRTTLDLGGRSLVVNRYMVQKGLSRQVVLYWYQGRGRVIANEYANKLWLMIDAARLHRSNGSLVRVVAPVAAATGGIQAADAAAADFARSLYPSLSTYLP
jgi:EpsI family protein